MSWGWKIVIVYGAFVVMTLAMVFYFMGHKVDLVAEDYYKQEIEYQSQIDKITNNRLLKEPLKFAYLSPQRKIIINFPKEHLDKGLAGTIHFYRPSNSDMDKEFDIMPSEIGEQVIAVGGLQKGFWKIKISWTANSREFYDEKTITL